MRGAFAKRVVVVSHALQKKGSVNLRRHRKKIAEDLCKFTGLFSKFSSYMYMTHIGESQNFLKVIFQSSAARCELNSCYLT